MPINTPDTTVINLRDVTVVNGHMVAIDLCVCRPQAIIWQARVCVIHTQYIAIDFPFNGDFGLCVRDFADGQSDKPSQTSIFALISIAAIWMSI